MKTYELSTSDAQLLDLIDQARPGEDVVLTKDRHPVARIIPLTANGRPTPRAGSLRGMIEMADDFDAPLEDFREYSA
jgi:antitoxin (DNA-binding transcriptional repressor) of toxin-antitoxin stability system